MKRLSGFIIKLFGWKLVDNPPTDKKFVVIALPHTSMMDFVWGKLVFWYAGFVPAIFIKKEMFFFPLGLLLRALGAVPINRSRSAGMVEQVIEYFNKNDEFSVCITPEGTRQLTNRLKRGFYFIARQANVPIYLSVLDYKTKSMIIAERFMTTDDIDADMEHIRNYYIQKNPTARHPKQFSTDCVRL
jgi:1-acyl-sn-glycerol-3-phosphate acyltransferase